jgi:hypothetical protein
MGSYVRQRSDVQFAAVKKHLGVSAEPGGRPLKARAVLLHRYDDRIHS